MTVIPELHPILETWLLEGPLSAQIPAYVNRLERGRYAAQTRQRCLSAVAHFAHWMSMCSMPARMIDEGCIEQFLRPATCLAATARAAHRARPAMRMGRWSRCSRSCVSRA